MIARILLGATLSTAALAQSYNAPAGIPAATAPGGLSGTAAPGGLSGTAAPENVHRYVQRNGIPVYLDERAATTGSIRGERWR